MKISELIMLLNRELSKNGDSEFVVWAHEGPCRNQYPIDKTDMEFDGTRFGINIEN